MALTSPWNLGWHPLKRCQLHLRGKAAVRYRFLYRFGNLTIAFAATRDFVLGVATAIGKRGVDSGLDPIANCLDHRAVVYVIQSKKCDNAAQPQDRDLSVSSRTDRSGSNFVLLAHGPLSTPSFFDAMFNQISHYPFAPDKLDITYLKCGRLRLTRAIHSHGDPYKDVVK